MIQKVPNIEGSLTQALDFKNIVGNIFPFETPPNTALSDFYILAEGGAGMSEVELPSTNVIDKAVSKVKNVAKGMEGMDFAVPTPNSPDINLLSEKISDATSEGRAAIESQREAVREALDLY